MELFFSKVLINNKFYCIENKNKIYRRYTDLVDLYLYLISSHFFTLAILQLVLLGLNTLCAILLALSILFFSFTFFNLKLKKIFHSIILITTSFILFFICLFTDFYFGYLLSYLMFLLMIPFTFHPKESFKTMIFIYILLVVQISIVLVSNYGLFFSMNSSTKIQNKILGTNIIICLFSLFIYWYLQVKKELIYSDLIQLNIDTINGLIEKPKNSIDKDLKLIELKNSAEKNPDLFYIKFSKHYPLFLNYFKTKYPELNINEIETCLFLILNYNSKDIARFTKNSVRAIESKKYRIRRKLDLNSNVNLNEFLILFFNQNNIDF